MAPSDGKTNVNRRGSDEAVHPDPSEGPDLVTANLAHQLNNLLTPIRGWAEIVASADGSVLVRSCGAKILEATGALVSISEALLAHTCQDTFDPVPSDLERQLSCKILPELRHRLPEHVVLHTDLAPGIHLDVDHTSFERAVVNLAQNAIDAMPNGGQLGIRLAVDPGDRSVCVLAISDTGIGMGPQERESMFRPFFTTKAAKRGLGLAFVHGLVRRHGGRIRVASTQGRGTTVTIELPAARTPSRHTQRAGDDRPRVLLVFGDPDVRDELDELVTEIGGEPRWASDLAGASELLDQGGLDLVFIAADLLAGDGARLVAAAERASLRAPLVIALASTASGAVTTLDGWPGRCLTCRLDRPLLTRVLSTLLHRP